MLPPIVILGQMRSGTTRLQRLLACDPRLAHTRMFESLMPIPRLGRRAQARAIHSLLGRLNPALAIIHPTSATAPEEEFGLFSFSFGSAQFEAQWRVPTFARWWEQRAKDGLYAEFRQLLATIAWSRGEKAQRRWVIKAPQFMQDLPALLDTFPGSAIFRLERDQAEIVSSSASLVWNQMRIQSDRADPYWIGKEWLRKTQLREAVATRTLATRKVAHLRLDYEAMNRDWRGEIRRAYDYLGMELPEAVIGRMANYLSKARGHHGHVYSPAQFGLEQTRLDSDPEAADQIAEMGPVIAPAA
jgi:hypothetical protein